MIKNNIIIAQKYSNAAFSFAKKQNITEDFLDDLKKISEAVSADFAKNLSNPFISKKSIIDSVNWLCDNTKVSDNIRSFIKIISLNKRLYLIKKIYHNYIEKYYEQKSLKKIEVFSCIELEKKRKSELEEVLKKSFSNSKIEISYKIDKKILGGLLIRQNNLIIDSSLKTYLNKLEANLIN
jgi:F-type H+-transporting ATPase subunit delta